jgi:hypothetical protein
MNVDERCGKFAQACWAFKRGERRQAPTGLEFGLHPYVATSIASTVGIDPKLVRGVKAKAQQTMKQQTLL